MRRRGCSDEGVIIFLAIICLLVTVAVVIGVTVLSYNVFDRAMTKAEKAPAATAEKPPEPKP